METKTCWTCKQEKPLYCFGKLSKAKDGLRNTCKDCRRKEYKKNAEANKARTLKNYYANHEEKKAKQRAYNSTRKELQREYMAGYYPAHKEAIKESVKQNRRKRLLTDDNFKILAYCRTRIYKAAKGINRSAGTKELLGCTIEELKAHIQAQFTEGMTWENYGEWHIDHIKPCALFDLTNDAELRACFHYTNLQPLWAKDNMHKHTKY